jgi:hypothetical protein
MTVDRDGIRALEKKTPHPLFEPRGHFPKNSGLPSTPPSSSPFEPKIRWWSAGFPLLRVFQNNPHSYHDVGLFFAPRTRRISNAPFFAGGSGDNLTQFSHPRFCMTVLQTEHIRGGLMTQAGEQSVYKTPPEGMRHCPFRRARHDNMI